MADRRVTGTGKNPDGDITQLCGSWGHESRANAIQQISSGIRSYYVQQPGCGRAEIHVVNGPTRRYLRSDPDTTSDNNLDNLPDC